MWCLNFECGVGNPNVVLENESESPNVVSGAAKVVLRMSYWLAFGKCFSVQDDVYLVYLFMSVLQFLQLN